MRASHMGVPQAGQAGCSIMCSEDSTKECCMVVPEIHRREHGRVSQSPTPTVPSRGRRWQKSTAARVAGWSARRPCKKINRQRGQRPEPVTALWPSRPERKAAICVSVKRHSARQLVLFAALILLSHHVSRPDDFRPIAGRLRQTTGRLQRSRPGPRGNRPL
jgi:hypothetical protein